MSPARRRRTGSKYLSLTGSPSRPQTLQLSIWDTAGQERYHALAPIYYRDAEGALLVYDITDATSFEKAKKWAAELKTVVGEGMVITIAGNKSDLEKNRNVKEADAVAFAESVGATHFHTSAKVGKGMEEAFLDMSKRLLEKKAKAAGAGRAGGVGAAGAGRAAGGGAGKKLLIVDEAPAKPPSSGCC